MKLKYILILSYLFLLQNVSFSQSFSASVNSEKVGLNNQFQVTFTFSGTSLNSLSNFHPPSFDNFMVLSGPNESTSMQIINGAVSASKSYSYYLQPKNLGKYKIGSASITYNGQSYSTKSLTIDVIKGSPKPKSNNSVAAQNSSPNISKKEIEKNLFIRAIADKKKVYLGQQVTVTYKLYTRLSIASQMSVNKLPQYNGCWAEELNTPNTISFTNETIDGKLFKVGVLKKAALFPSQTGTLDVTPMDLTIPIQVQNRRNSGNFFDNFFNNPFGQSQTYNYDAKSNVLKIKVEPLPDKNVPPSFNGAVGDFTMSTTLDKNKVAINEPLNLKVTISGTGNIKLLDMPAPKLPTGLEQYEPKTNTNINRESIISGKKEVDYLLIPRISGQKVITPIEFSYFNINEGKYITLKSPEFKINVEPGAGGNNYANSSPQQSNIKLLGNDIRYIKTSYNDVRKKGGILLYQSGFWIAAGLPLIFLVGLVTYKKRSDKIASDVQLLKFQRAQKVAKSRLKTAKEMMTEKNQNGFYSEISLALFGYLEDKLHMPKSEFSLESAIDKLRGRKVQDTVLNNLKICAEKCEYMRFAPQKDGMGAMNEVYNESANVIIEIEKILSSKKV